MNSKLNSTIFILGAVLLSGSIIWMGLTMRSNSRSTADMIQELPDGQVEIETQRMFDDQGFPIDSADEAEAPSAPITPKTSDEELLSVLGELDTELGTSIPGESDLSNIE